MLNSALLNEGLTSLFNHHDPLEAINFLVNHYGRPQTNIQPILYQGNKVQ